MIVIETVLVAFAMFSALPLPRPAWNEKNMRFALCAFPLIGVVCGLLWWGWSALCAFLTAPDLLRGAGFCLIPVLVTGGIHLAFAVIRLCAYFAAYFALCAALRDDGRALWSMGLAFVLERALSGLAVTRFPLAKNTGLAHTFATSADRTAAGRVLTVLCVLSGAGMIAAGGASGIAMLAAALLVFLHFRVTADRQFGGLSGDLSGWFLQRAELWMLGALVACQLLEAKFL